MATINIYSKEQVDALIQQGGGFNWNIDTIAMYVLSCINRNAHSTAAIVINDSGTQHTISSGGPFTITYTASIGEEISVTLGNRYDLTPRYDNESWGRYCYMSIANLTITWNNQSKAVNLIMVRTELD